MNSSESEIENAAKMLRKTVRAKAGLGMDWEKATEEMKQWYRNWAAKLEKGETF